MNDIECKDDWWTRTPPTGRMLRPADVAERIRLSKSQIYEMINQGAFPPFVKLSTRASALPEAWLDSFIERKTEVSLREEGESKW